jgi:hypothetical protein
MDSFLAWFQKVEKVQFLSIEERALTFKAKKAFKIGSRPTISISIPVASGGSEDFKLPVTITRVRQVGKGAVVCTGLVPGAAQNVEQLRQILSGVDPNAPDPFADGDDGENMRRARRFHWSIRVLSKDLPGFRAISLDFNRLGVKLSTEGPAEIGKVISLMLEIETAKTHEVLCQGLVRWNKEITRRKYEVGVEFTELDPEVVRELENFERFLEGRGNDDVAKRQVMDSSFYETEAFGPGVDDLVPAKQAEEAAAETKAEAESPAEASQ